MTVPGAILALVLSSLAQRPSQPPFERDVVEPNAPVRTAVAASDVDRAVAAGDYARAERLLAAAIEKDPTSTALLKRIATVFLMDRKPLNAAIALKKAEAIAPLDSQTRLQLALAYIAMARPDWARPELERLSKAEPANVIYSYWLARLDYDAGQYASAIERLQVVVRAQPDFVRAHDNLGLSYEALNRADDAIPHYREAVRLNRLDPDGHSPWPALNLGILLRSRDELAEAERLFREALSYSPRFAPAHYQLGVLLEQTGRMEDAVKSLRHAAEADPTNAEPHYALARIYRREGKAADADKALATFQRLHNRGGEPRP